MIPRTIEDLDFCNHLLNKFDPELDQKHPGFSDLVYRKRRQQIAEKAYGYKSGMSIPYIDYQEDETLTWRNVYNSLKLLYKSYACQQYIDAFNELEKCKLYTDKSIPQLENVSNFLKRKTGFQLRPVAGLLSARDFLASLAFRVFQCTQYIRHASKPDHTVEPDCVHELLGHVPMLANPEFAEFSQEIGLASLGASDENIEKLSTVYWFTVEFGLCKQEGQLKAYGAGLLSAYGELKYSLSDNATKLIFDPEIASVQKYDDQNYQSVYFVAESFEDMKKQVKKFALTLNQNLNVCYDPYTQTVSMIDDQFAAGKLMKDVKEKVYLLSQVMSKLKIDL
ncbi:hypothetical protein HELRODRAFT_66944 [Helobdella robusta]|uniref:Biopterin-dependent aromatic amino acid hydroxylase family profile domain-containing protein n=1 Tax=Helobdella robusta TaxID=6412 RepID=T1FYT6_HELRO|nr:hypothetical protein HELRODRAFT_66944 [Helobdella robusta]ESN99339.1 hypothetical protein HELRODRAFT_66944 [Helobdella robusta]